MIGLVAGDALHDSVLVVPAGAGAGDLPRRPARGTVFAVFDPPAGVDPDTGETGVAVPASGLPAAGLRGLAPAAARSTGPSGTFAEMAVTADGIEPPEPVDASLSLPETLRRLRTAPGEVLAVIDDSGRFLGVVTPASITAALLRREQELLKKSREYRASVHEDKRRRFETVRRLERMNVAFRKLLGLVARPPGRELFHEGIEALAMATDARFGAVQVLDAAPADDAEPGREAARAGRPGDDGTAPPGTGPRADDESAAADFLAQRRLLLQQVLRGNRVVSIADAPTYLRRAGVPMDRPMLKTFLGVPVGRAGRVFGAVYLCDKAEGPFNDDDETLAAGFARGLASAMAQAREAGQRRRAERQRDLLNHLARELAAADTFDKAGAAMLAATEEYWGWDAFSFSVRRSGRGRFRTLMQADHANDDPAAAGAGAEGPGTRAARARTDEADADRGAEQADLAPRRRDPTQWGGEAPGAANRSQPNERRFVLQELLAGRPVLFNRDPAATPDPGSTLKRFGDTARPSASLVYAPVRVDGETLGVVSLHSYKPGYFTEADRDLLLRVADGAGPAIARCEAERRGRVLGGLGHALSTAVSPKEAARVVAAAADELLGFDACTVYLFDAARGETHGVLMMDMIDGERGEITPKQPLGPASPLALKVMAEGPQIILRAAAAFDTPGTGPSPFGDRGRPSLSLMYAPLRTSAGPNGVLSIQSYEPDRYDARDLALLQELADFCSGALERTRTRERA